MGLVLITICPVGSAYSQDGNLLYTTKFCITCHGTKGVSIAPNYPNLARQNVAYLINQANDIISGKRTSKLTILMTANPVVKAISEEELKAISSYLLTLK